MSKWIKAVAVVGACVSISACATVTRGTNTAWEVNTIPAGAKVKTSNGYFCESTPCSLKMPRKSTFTASITHDGYKPVDVEVTNHVAGGGGAAMAGNVLVGGLIGAGVDVASGAMLDLTPNPANVTLEKVDEPLPAPTGADPAAVSPPVAPDPTTPAAPPTSAPPAMTPQTTTPAMAPSNPGSSSQAAGDAP